MTVDAPASGCSYLSGRAQILFAAIFLGSFYALLAASVTLLDQGSGTAATLYLLLLGFFLLLLTYDFAQVTLAMLLPERDPLKRPMLTQAPGVALLYLTRDDLVDICLHNLAEQTYPNVQVFVLDDSEDAARRRRVDAISAEHGFVVVRRERGSGYKAGNLNNWLNRFGAGYEYFVIADADSMFPPDFVSRMVEYAEHGSNSRVAMFQSKIGYWNTGGDFPGAMNALAPVGMWVLARIGNRLGIVLSWGHNNLCRTQALLEVDGYDERFVSEDTVTAWKLMARGWECVLVDVYSEEGVPSSIAAHTRRTVKWARSSLQVMKCRVGRLPMTTRLQAWMLVVHYFAWPLMVAGTLGLVYSHTSTVRDIPDVVTYLVSPTAWSESHVWAFTLIMAFNLYFLLGRVPIALRCGVTVPHYLSGVYLNQVRTYFAVWPLLRGFATFHRHRFDVTDKAGLDPASLGKVGAGELVASLVLSGAFLFGLWHNPVALLFGWVWMVPLVLTPAVVLSLQLHRAHDDLRRHEVIQV
jgi:hypothetical protein